jgi:hypothetical protein
MAFASGRIPNKNVIAIKEPITYDLFCSSALFVIEYSSQLIGVIQTHIMIFLSPFPLPPLSLCLTDKYTVSTPATPLRMLTASPLLATSPRKEFNPLRTSGQDTEEGLGCRMFCEEAILGVKDFFGFVPPRLVVPVTPVTLINAAVSYVCAPEVQVLEFSCAVTTRLSFGPKLRGLLSTIRPRKVLASVSA